MTLTMTHYDTTVTVSVTREDMTLNEVVEALVKPALLGLGFAPETIADVLGGER